MVIVKLQGGLGNQMFQYAAGKAIAVRNNCQLGLDITDYQNKLSDITPRNYELHHFHVDTQILEEDQLRAFKKLNLFEKIISKLKPYYRRRIYNETGFSYDLYFCKLKPPLLLSGYWQSEK